MSRRHELRAVGVLVMLAVGAAAWLAMRDERTVIAARSSMPAADGATVVADAFRERRSDVHVELTARVARVLPDDGNGDRHQRFILELPDDQTLLVAHNIDLAPRVPVDVGDEVRVRGEYEWNEEGGVLHWTHRNPARDARHAGGWIEVDGQRYE
jgi:hypothetical protein